MAESFESMLTGGHPNSLGRTVEVFEAVLADRKKLNALYRCYFSADEVVRLRTASAMKRVTIAQPDWVMDFMDGLQTEIAAIDQASTQWTLALIFDLTRDRMSPAQKKRALEILKRNLAEHGDWIVLNNTMQVLADWAVDDPALTRWLRPHLKRLIEETRKSVAARAQKLTKKLYG